MFKIENGYLVFEEFKVLLPKEVRAKAPSKIFGTSTTGLLTKRGVFLDADGASGRVGLVDGSTLSGHIINDRIKPGTLVHIREQLDVNNPLKTFWLISAYEITPQLNWVTIEFEDKSILKICPFTGYYVT